MEIKDVYYFLKTQAIDQVSHSPAKNEGKGYIPHGLPLFGLDYEEDDDDDGDNGDDNKEDLSESTWGIWKKAEGRSFIANVDDIEERRDIDWFMDKETGVDDPLGQLIQQDHSESNQKQPPAST